MRDLETKALVILVHNPHLIAACQLEANDFERAETRKVYAVLRELAERGEVVDAVAIHHALGGQGLDYFAEELSEAYEPALHLEDVERKLRAERSVREFKLKAQDVKSVADIEALSDSMIELEIGDTVLDAEGMLGAYDKAIEVRRAKETQGVVTGFKSLDQNCLLAPSRLVTLAARSSIGKSALAGNLAISAAMFKQKVVFLTTEMAADEMMDRFLAYLTGHEVWRFTYAKNGNHISEGRREFAQLQGYFYFISEPKLFASSVAKAVIRYRPDLVVVDYLQLLGDLSNPRDTKNNLIDMVTYKLKQLAMKYNCCVLLLSQVNRNSANNTGGMPQIHELRDSGSIEQNSDVVLILNRESRDSTEGVLHVAKNRAGQSEMMIALKYKPRTVTFSE